MPHPPSSTTATENRLRFLEAIKTKMPFWIMTWLLVAGVIAHISEKGQMIMLLITASTIMAAIELTLLRIPFSAVIHRFPVAGSPEERKAQRKEFRNMMEHNAASDAHLHIFTGIMGVIIYPVLGKMLLEKTGTLVSLLLQKISA